MVANKPALPVRPPNTAGMLCPCIRGMVTVVIAVLKGSKSICSGWSTVHRVALQRMSVSSFPFGKQRDLPSNIQPSMEEH